MEPVSKIRAIELAKTAYLPFRAPFAAALLAIATTYAVAGHGPLDNATGESFKKLFGENGPVNVEGSSFKWLWTGLLDGRDPNHWHRAVFLARPSEGALRELYAADFKISSDRRIRDFRRVRNISRTSDADENVLAADGAGRVAYGGRADGAYRTLVVMDFSGEKPKLTERWTKWQRIAAQVTNFQNWGRKKGVDYRHFIFSSPPRKMQLRYDGRVLDVSTEDVSFRIDENGRTNSASVVAQEMVKAPQAMLSFAVDTARAVPWIGSERIAWLEKNWFDFVDWLARMRYAVDKDVSPPFLSGVATSQAQSDLPDWPPPDMKPIIEPKLEGEGRWFQLEDRLFSDPRNGPFLFYFSFMRADPERPFAKVYMTVWDPSRVELRIMAGTIEPAPSTGIPGVGEVPRGSADDQVSRLVAAFNGAFQSLHGQWGMALDGKPLLPPRPYAATVAVLDDNRIGMGAWPNPIGEIPEEIRDFRQNLVPLVQDGLVNPFKYKFWGASPENVPDRVYTVRTSICLTKAGKVIYFFGDHLTHDTLGGVMAAAGCDFGMHLDMNVGHSGFEYYRVDPLGKQPKLARKLKASFEAEGEVPRRPELFFRARKMVEDMAHMRFPRYISRDPRDFFYLLRKKSIFDDPPEQTAEWKPLAVKPAVPVPAASAELECGLLLYKIDLGQTEITLETEKPSDAIVAFPFSTSKEGVSTGVKRKGEVLEKLNPGEPAVRLDSPRPAFVRADEKQEGATLIQGVPETIGRSMGSQVGLAVDSNGYLIAALGQSAIVNELFEELKKVGGDNVLGLLPAGSDDRDPYWITVRHKPLPAWERIFPEVKPVPREVLMNVYWKPKKDPEEAPGDSSGTEPTSPPAP